MASMQVFSGCLSARPGSAARLFSPRPLNALPVIRPRAVPRQYTVRAASAETDADDEGLTGEWPVNWSLASYEDVGEFFQNSLFKDSASPGNSLQEIMSTDLTYVTPDTKVDDLGQIFAKVRRQAARPIPMLIGSGWEV